MRKTVTIFFIDYYCQFIVAYDDFFNFSNRLIYQRNNLSYKEEKFYLMMVLTKKKFLVEGNTKRCQFFGDGSK